MRRCGCPHADGYADRVADGVANRDADGLANRVANRDADGLANRLADGLANRLADGLAHRVADDLANRVTDGFADSLAYGGADGVANGLANRLADGLANRLADGVANRIADGLANRLADGGADHDADSLADGGADHDADGLADRDAYGHADRDAYGDFHSDAHTDPDPRAGRYAATHFGCRWPVVAQQAAQTERCWVEARNSPREEGPDTMSMAAKQLGRLEFKYLIDETTAARVCRELEPYCTLDRYGLNASRTAHSPASSYPVRSLYLDTPTFAFHRAKERGDAERFKLRVRGYDGRQVFYLEIKYRSADFVWKRRIGIDARSLAETGREVSELHQATPQGRRVAEEFGRRVLSTAASPKLLVRYDRVAYSSDVDHYARVTFDRNIQFQQAEQWNLEGRHGVWSDLQRHLIEEAPNPLVIMEIKTIASVPRWLIDVIHRQGLRRNSVSKYSLGIYLTYRFRYLSAGRERARGLLN